MSESVFHEYPKARYRDGVYRAVADRDEEDAALAEGWVDWHSDQGQRYVGEAVHPTNSSMVEQPTGMGAGLMVYEPTKRRGRPPKAAQ